MALRQTTFGAAEVLRRLGIQGDHLPQLQVASYQPVIIMGDFSRSLAAEPLEARGWAGVRLGAVAARYAAFSLQCMCPGGLIIEKILITLPNVSGNEVLLQARVTVIDFNWNPSPPTTAFIDDVGGYPPNVTSVLRAGYVTGTLGGAFNYLTADRTNAQWCLGNERIYVRPGLWFEIQATDANQVTNLELLWREIPEVPGIP